MPLRASSTCWQAGSRGRVPNPPGGRPPASLHRPSTSYSSTDGRKAYRMRLGLIGLGRIGAFHTNTLVGIPAIDSLVVTDLVPEKNKTIVEQFGEPGVEGVDSLEAVLGSGIDGVIIAAGTDAHTKLILACVEAGLPTLCEKPVGSHAAEGADLLRRLQGSTVPVQIGFQRRYDAAIAAAKKAVDSGELGWINTIRSTTLAPEPPTEAYVSVSGGMYRDCGVHDFDIIRF